MVLKYYSKLSLEVGSRYDFLETYKSGNVNEPDRSALVNAIYSKLFKFYDRRHYSGDTLNTYRTAIRRCYGKFFISMPSNEQEDILKIIEHYSTVSNQHTFSFFMGNSNRQICNNYQLGNFLPLSKKTLVRTSLNIQRSRFPYSDYFDRYLEVVDNYYSKDFTEQLLELSDNLKIRLAGNLEAASDEIISEDIQKLRNCLKDRAIYDSEKIQQLILMKVIQFNSTKDNDYFRCFAGFEDYVRQNYLEAFFTAENSFSKKTLVRLSEAPFEKYVELSNQIIRNRGETLFKELQKSY